MGLYDPHKSNNKETPDKPASPAHFGQPGPGSHMNNNDQVKHGSPSRVGTPAPHQAPVATKGPAFGQKSGGPLGEKPTNVQKGTSMPVNHPQGHQPSFQKTVTSPAAQKAEPAKPGFQKTVSSPAQNHPQKTVNNPSQQGYQKTVNWPAQGGAALQGSLGAPFTVSFSENINYVDPVYNLVELIFAGAVEVSSKDMREGDQARQIVTNTVKATLTQELSKLGAAKKNMNEIYSEYNNLKDACVRSLQQRGMDVSRFNLNAFAPSDKSKERIDQTDKMNAAGQMSPREMQKQREEAQRSAQSFWDNKTNVEKARPQSPSHAQAQLEQNQMYGNQMGQMYPNQMNQPYMDNMNLMGYNAAMDPYQAQMMQGQMGQMNQAQMYGTQMQGAADMASKMPYDAKVGMDGAPMNSAAGAFAGAAAAVAGAFAGQAGADAFNGAAGNPQTAAPGGFCPNCGTPNSGSSFCMNCGTKL